MIYGVKLVAKSAGIPKKNTMDTPYNKLQSAVTCHNTSASMSLHIHCIVLPRCGKLVGFNKEDDWHRGLHNR